MVMDNKKNEGGCMQSGDERKSKEKNHTEIKSVQSLPDTAFDSSSSSRSSKIRFRKKGSPTADVRGTNSSDATKRKKSLGQQCRSFLSRLFRSRSRDYSPESQNKCFQTSGQDPRPSPFSKSVDNTSTQSVRLKPKPPIDVAMASPNNSFQIKSHQSCEEIRHRSNSFSEQSPTSSVKSSSSPTPRAIVNISPTLKVVAITPTGDNDRSLTTAQHTSNDCVVLNLTQTEVQSHPVELKSVQSSTSDALKITSSDNYQHNSKLKSPGYCVTVTPNIKSAYAGDYHASDKNVNTSRNIIPSIDIVNMQNKNIDVSQSDVSMSKPNKILSNEEMSTNLHSNTNSITLNVRPTEASFSYKQPIASPFSENIFLTRHKNQVSSSEESFSSEISKARDAHVKINRNDPKVDESQDELDEILDSAMKQLMYDDSRLTSQSNSNQFDYLMNPPHLKASIDVKQNIKTSKGTLVTSDIDNSSQQGYSFSDSGSSSAGYPALFSKDPLILYSRSQSSGDTGALSPDSGVSSIQSPATESLTNFSRKTPYELTHESLSTDESLDFPVLQQTRVTFQPQTVQIRAAEFRQTPQHFVYQPDKKLINVVTPTPFVDSQIPVPAPRYASGKIQASNIFSPEMLDSNYENTKSRTLNPKLSSNPREFELKEKTQSFPRVPPPSYNSVIVKGDPVDLGRFKDQDINFTQGGKSSTVSRNPAKIENVYDMIPANVNATRSLLTDEGIYEQIPFQKFNEGSASMARMTVEPKMEHIEFCLKPILPHSQRSMQPNFAPKQNSREFHDYYFPTIVKPPVKDFRINEAMQQELRNKLKNVGNVDDRYNRIKEEYLGFGSPSQTSYKPHPPQTFAPVQVVQESFEAPDRDYYSEDEIMQKRLHLEKVMDMERQKKALRERLDLQSRRHGDHFGGTMRSTTSADVMRKDLMYDNIEPLMNKKITKYRGRAKALYNFKAQKARELSLRKGDVVYLLRRIDRNWFEGEHHGMIGIFPISYVEVLESIEEVQSIARMREGSATVLYDFYPRSPLELPLKKGYVVTLIRKLDSNWYEGRCGNKQGVFPAAYVSTIREPDTPLATPCATPLPTPSPSRMQTPLPGCQPGWQSPSASSMFSINPDIPVAPRSPTMFSVDFSRESTPFGGSIIGAPTYFHHRPSSVMSEPVHVRECRTLPLNIMRPLAQDRSPAFIDKRYPLRSMTMQRNVYDNKDFSDCMSECGWSGRPEIRSGRGHSLFYKNVQAPTTLTTLNKNLNMDMRTVRKKPAKLSFAPIPEKDSEAEMIKPIIYPRYRALHDFVPRSPEELILEKNEIVRVVEKCKDGWYIGFLESTRQFGLFPGNFVEPLRP